MDCPKCGQGVHCKDGIVKGRQRYLCKSCGHHYTVSKRSGTSDSATRRQVLELYLEGLGFRSIGRVLKFSNVSILNWIRGFGEQLDGIKSSDPVAVMGLDEMHSYIGSKKRLAGYGLLLIEMGDGFSKAYWAAVEPSPGENSGNP